MSTLTRNNVRTYGTGEVTLIFSHGFGCDQSMWRFLTPRFESRFKIILFDLVGSGDSDLSAYDTSKYATLDGHASDVWEILDEHASGPIIFVGHSVSSMIGLIVDISRPGPGS